MSRGRVLVLVGALLLIIGGFLPWISVPNLFGLSGTSFESIEIGWEGDGFLAAGIGLMLILGELLLWGDSRRWFAFIGVVLAGLAAFVVFLDFRRILDLAPEAGFYAATDIGIYVTLVGALLALIGCMWRRVKAPTNQRMPTTNSLV